MNLAPRSLLFVPASFERAIAKAPSLDCDALAIDLEDAIGPADKTKARNQARAAFENGLGDKRVTLRINGRGSAWGDDDLRLATELSAANQAGSRLHALILPKVQSAADVTWAAKALPNTPIWAMIETTQGLVALDEIARTPVLQALILGQNDLTANLRAQRSNDRGPLQWAMAALVAHARAQGLWALDGVYTALEDIEGLAAEARQGCAFGFDGKTIIHPNQIGPVNTAFSPSAAELGHARAIIDTFALAEKGAGAIRMGAEMIERLHLERAQALIARFGRR